METPKPTDSGVAPLPALAQVVNEVLSNANNLKGPDFANYTASLVELAQLNDVLRRLADPALREGRDAELLASGTHFVHSIHSKLFPDLSDQDRHEAGILAGDLIARALKLREDSANG